MNEGPILLVEDNSDDAILIRLELEKRRGKREVVLAESGETALDYLFSESERYHPASRNIPSLIILDLDLGTMNGEQVLKRVRAENKTHHVPVVIFTSSDRDSTVKSLYESGANGYVNKPSGYDDFKETVNRIADYWLWTNKAALR